MSEKLKELISLLYQDKLTNFGKDQLVRIIEKLRAENIKLRFQDIPYLEGELKAYKVRIEELKQDNLEYQRIQDTFDERCYRKKYLEERRAEEEDLLYPDADEVYERYFKQREMIQDLEKKNKKLKELTLISSPWYISQNYIPKQKIKEKIKILKQQDSEWKDELSEPNSNFKNRDKNLKRIKNQIDVLEELLKQKRIET